METDPMSCHHSRYKSSRLLNCDTCFMIRERIKCTSVSLFLYEESFVENFYEVSEVLDEIMNENLGSTLKIN